ncbi:MAG: SDR family oxidoreductase [Actinomycetota bacterium]
MTVVIVGGHGKIALRLARLLSGRGDAVRALIRNQIQADDVRAAGAEPILCDLESVDADELASAVGAADAVVFAAGAGPGSGSARKETVDYGGATKLIAAAKANGIARYVMVSSIGADATAKGDETFAVYLRAKGRADEQLVKSGLDYTIVRPTRLTDDPGDGLVRIGESVERGSVPRDDVAAVIAAALEEPKTIGRVLELTDGDQPIAEALGAL